MALSDRPPAYLSSRAADVVLSEIRPTRLAPEALRSVNVLLDELLWMVLSAAHSFATEQLKASLNKLLPTPAGKEALLEAEVELRAYWERSTPSSPPKSYLENTLGFPLQPAFELLRLKCEAYSTFNDTDEDADNERSWQLKLTANGFPPHNLQYIAPAALYLTAIMEHVCERILSNTGRVAARDSSRSMATVQDLYVALCEDNAIYGLFKNMKVHGQIEQQSKPQASRRRSKSIQYSVGEHARDPSLPTTTRTSSPLGLTSTNDGPIFASRSRVSLESAGSGTAVATASSASRTSVEKSKARKLFGRISMEKDPAPNGYGSADIVHRRSASLRSNSKRSASALEESQGSSPNHSEVDFDELMRSGMTMKVSLTPDRLRTFEVYSKEKGRNGMSKIMLPPLATSPHQANPTPLQDSTVMNSAGASQNSFSVGAFQQRRQVDVILEDQDHSTHGESKETSTQRARRPSRGAPPVSYEKSSSVRTRSASQSSVPSSPSFGSRTLGHKGSKGSFNLLAPESLKVSLSSPVQQHSSSHTLSDPNLTARGQRKLPSSYRGSFDDLEESSDEEFPGKKPTRHNPLKGVSAQTAELISFLSEGPPELPKLASHPGIFTSLEKDIKKRGRLRSIVSRLTGANSIDKVSSSSSNDELANPNQSKLSLNSQILPYVPPPLSAKRSLASLTPYSQPQDTPPKLPPPPVPPLTIPASNPSSSKPCEPTPTPTKREKSPTGTRKAVPIADFSEESTQVDMNTKLSKPDGVSSPSSSELNIEYELPSKTVSPSRGVDSAAMMKTSIVVSAGTIFIPDATDCLSSKQSHHHAAPVSPAQTNFTLYVSDLRRCMTVAANVDECRLLVDMFLAKSGFPINVGGFPPSFPDAPSAQYEIAVIEALLNDGDISPATDQTGQLDSNGNVTKNS